MFPEVESGWLSIFNRQGGGGMEGKEGSQGDVKTEELKEIT